MLTLKQLIAMTPEKVRKKTNNPDIKVVKDLDQKKFGTKKFRAVYTKTRLKNKESTGRAYTLIIRNHGTKKDAHDFFFKPESNLWVHCSCPYFTFNLEVALTLRKSSSIYDSNGEMPRIKNPYLKPYLCKHLYATILALVLQDQKRSKSLHIKPKSGKITGPKETKPEQHQKKFGDLKNAVKKLAKDEKEEAK